MIRTLAPAALLAVAACGPFDTLPALDPAELGLPPREFPDPCGARAWQSYEGRQLNDVTFPYGLPARIDMPGDGLTHRYVAERITFEVDELGTIVEVRCG